MPSTMPRVAAPLSGEGLELLASLRRLREDSRVIGEYVGSLDSSLEKRLAQDEQRAGATLRKRHVDHLNLQQDRRAWQRQVQLLEDVFQAWHLRAAALQSLCRLESTAVRRFSQLQDMLCWRRNALWQRNEAEVASLSKSLKEREKRLEREVFEAQNRVSDERKQMQSSAMKLLQSQLHDDVESLFFSEWHTLVVHKKTQTKKILRLGMDLVERNVKGLDREILLAWRHVVAAHLRKFAEHKAKERVKELFVKDSGDAQAAEQGKLLALCWSTWRTETVLSKELRRAEKESERIEELCKKELEEQFQRRQHTLKRTAQMLFGSLPAMDKMLDAWYDVAESSRRLRLAQAEQESLKRELEWTQRLVQSDESLYRSWVDVSSGCLVSWEARRCFEIWAKAYAAAVKAKLIGVESECRELDRERCEVVQRSRQAWIDAGAVALAQSLRAPALARLRSAWLSWAAPRASAFGDAVRDLSIADASARACALERKRLEHSVAGTYRSALRVRELAYAAAVSVTKALCLDFLRCAFGLWRLVRRSELSEVRLMRNALDLRGEELRFERDLEERRQAKIKYWLDVLGGRESFWVSITFCAWRDDIEAINRDKRLEKQRASLYASRVEHDREMNQKLQGQLRERKRRVSLAILTDRNTDDKLMLGLAFHGWMSSFRDRKAKAASIIRLIGMSRMMSIFDRVPATVDECIICWRACALLTKLTKRRQAVEEQLAHESLQMLQRGSAVGVIVSTVTCSARMSLMAMVFALWRRRHCDERVDRAAVQAQQRWWSREASAQEELGACSTRCSMGKRTLERGLERVYCLHLLQWTLRAWRWWLRVKRDEADLALWEHPGGDMARVQARLEAAAHEQNAERCLAMRRKVTHSGLRTRVFSCWLLVARSQRAAQQRAKRAARALHIGEQRATSRVEQRLRSAFAGWLERANQRRTKWLERRCRQLRALEPHRFGVAPASPSLPDGLNGLPLPSTRVSWLEGPHSRQFHFAGVKSGAYAMHSN